MQVSYNDKTDLLYIRLDSETQEVINRDIADGITVDIGAGDRIVGIEILDASRRLDLRQVLPVSSGVLVQTDPGARHLRRQQTACRSGTSPPGAATAAGAAPRLREVLR